MNKSLDNISRYLSSLRRFASLKEILQNHDQKIVIFAVPGCRRYDTEDTTVSTYKGAKLPPIAGSTISRYRPLPLP